MAKPISQRHRSLRIRDAGIAIECSGGRIHINGDIGWIVSVVAVPGLGTSWGVGRGGMGHCVNVGNGLVTGD